VVGRKSKPVMHVALLRGINVGKAKRIAMSDLRALCESLGYGDVKTLLNSGNVVFSAPRADAKAATRIQKEIAAQTGISCRVMTLTADELDAVIAENPIAEGETNPSRFLVTVLANPADRARVHELTKQDWGNERLGVGTHAAYLWCADGILESRLVAATSKLLADAATSRNWATISKLQELMRGDA
jgi:uncharacterized protein (DUF1697 family)